VTAQPSTGYLSDPPRGVALSHGPEAEALLDEVRASLATLTGLLVYQADLGQEVAVSIRQAVEEVERRLKRRELRVAIVGESGSGKSTLLDALLGERLLGLTATEPSIVISVRRAEQRAYRARMTTGAIEDFASRVPDATPKLAQALASAEVASLEAKRRSEEATIEFVAASDAVDVAEADLNAAFRAFEAARDEASRLGAELDRAERAEDAALEEAARSEAALPAVLRKRPPWWAFWWWLVRFVVLAFTIRAFRAHRRLLRAGDDATSDVGARKLDTSRAAERVKQAETDLAAANGPVEQSRKAQAATKRIRSGADSRREELEREAEKRREELEAAREERRRRFALEVRTLTDPAARAKEVAELDIEFPARHLPNDVVILDAAGASSDDVALRDRAWNVIREQADGCIVVSELEHAVNAKAQKFLEQLRDAVPHAILVLTKMDESLSWAQKKGVGDPWEEVERARKIGTRRFAREVGRDPNAVLSIAVAAEEALRGGEAAGPARRGFEADIEAAFTLLRQERALILGARSAGIVRRCIGGAADAETHAERFYRDRIAGLEAQRIPGPELFHAEQMQAAEGAIASAAKRVIGAAKKTLADHTGVIRVECAALVAKCNTKDDLRALPPHLWQVIAKGLSLARQAVRAELDAQAGASLRQLESSVIGALRERYQLLHELDPQAGAPLRVEAALDGPLTSVELAPLVERAVRSFDQFRIGFGAGGAVAGATAGTLLLPGLGTAAGALAGGLLTFARTFGSLRQATISATDGVISDFERDLAQKIDAAEPAAIAAMRAGLARAIEKAIARFNRWISEPIEAEREAIDRERENLRDLEMLRLRLAQHDARLAWLIEAASGASVGLHA
jgi:hypothetical protein